ncbi:M13 family metallopeptidase [Flocculibacter collagenilyticus]|uniref:M13 family metallopeptidase n=1 Tax=Flocculibacter collagenilyticus TaxID=2744479 RepID=UPI0018F39BA7|nr:M13-type metalloendopeptidase [Flocculibacter collagenilyticus]
MKKVTAIAAGVALALGLAACSPQNSETASSTKSEVAESKQQLISGVELENFDKSVNPADDFYTYVNGKWLERTEIPADRSNYGSFSKLYDDSQNAMKKLIEEAAANKNATPGSNEQKLGDFYKAYMDTELAEELKLAPIKPDLTLIKSINTRDDYVAAMAYLQKKGVTTPFGWYVNNDAKNSKEYAVYTYQSGTALPDRDYYLENAEKFEKIRKEYIIYVTDMLKAAGHEHAEKAAQSVFEFEKKLAENHWTRVQSRDATKRYNKYSAADLNKAMGEFPWDKYAEQVGLASAESIIVSQPSYFEAFGELFANTDIQTLKDYMMFHTIDGAASLLHKELVDRHFAFHSTVLSGVAEQKPRWKKAVDSANGVIGEILGQLYVKEYFKPEAKERMEEMVDNLIKAYGIAIDELEWMSEETKKAAKVKLSKFTPKIGYPDKWKDYSDLDIKADDLVGNFTRFSEWTYQDMASKIGKPVDRSEWHMTPQTVNAYFNPVNNEIVFPAAILQPPFFNLEADDAVNYGGIGAVIGHELGHGFDDQGAKYNGDGNLVNWWTEQDLKEFQTRGAKLASQYAAYAPFEDASVNGELTLGENIGDLGGLTVALKAYELSLDGKKAPVMDGFTGTQRFFIGWSQVWRRKYRDEELRRRLMTDPHSPSQYRVIGIVASMPEFYQAFDVKEGDAMYIAPEDRVKIW